MYTASVQKRKRGKNMTITDIIRNEITLSIGHNPDKDELQKFIDYIHDSIADSIRENKKIYISQIEIAILDCKKENFIQCEECGEWFLPSEINEATGCCTKCTPYEDPDYYYYDR